MKLASLFNSLQPYVNYRLPIQPLISSPQKLVYFITILLFIFTLITISVNRL